MHPLWTPWCLFGLLAVAFTGLSPRQDSAPQSAESDSGAPLGRWSLELEMPDGSRRPWTLPATPPWQPSAGTLLPDGALIARHAQVGPIPNSAPAADQVLLELAGGDSLTARASGGRGDQLLLELGGALMALEIDQIQSLRFPERLPADPGLVLEPAESGDRLYRRVAERLDRVDGTLDSLSAEGVAFESLVGRQVVPWEELAALFIESLGEIAAQPSGPRSLVLSLADGSRLRGQLVSLDQERLTLELPSGDALVLPSALVAQIEAADGRLAFLSDLKPESIEPARPFGDDLGMVWWPRADLAVHGAPLMVAGRRYFRGYGCSTPTRLTFALNGAWRELRGSIAIDDSVLASGLTGSVRFKVLVDGEERYASPELGRQEAPIDLPALPLVGAQRLELVTEMASDLFEGDRANWLDLRLLR